MEGAISAPLADGKAVAITVVRGPDTGAKFELTSARIVIGRKRGDVLLRDRETSSLHASIEQAPDGRFILKDLGSTNGTWLEGKRITVAEILPGQHLKVGANHLLFSVADGASEATRQGPIGAIQEDLGDVSLPSPWTGAPRAPDMDVGGPLDVDLGMPDFGPMSGSSGPLGGDGPLAAPPPPAPTAWPAPPPAVSPWPVPPPSAPAAPPSMPPPPAAVAPPPPQAPVDPLNRTTPGLSARTLPERQRVDAPPPLPPLPSWPAAPLPKLDSGTELSPARPLAEAPASNPASAPAPASTAGPSHDGGLPPGVERSVYGVYLVVERGRDRGRVFPVNRQVTVLGRSGTEILINDPDISRRHAALDVQGEGKYVLRDLNSTNGTLLNGVAVQSESISPNDKIRMGSTTIKLVVGDDRVAAELHRLAAEGH